MRKQDLKDGMVVELRNGERNIILNGKVMSFISFTSLDGYNNDLTDKNTSRLDIVKVFSSDINILNDIKTVSNVIWERKKEVDWSKVPIGTKVVCWDDCNKKYEGIFLRHKKNEYIYPFYVYVPGNEEVVWKHCEVNSEEIESYDIEQKWFESDEDDFNEWLFKNFHVIRKQV